MDKIRIGENEYQPPFRELDDEEMDEVWVMDAGNNYVKVESVIAALNELAQLRAERDGLVKRVEELEKLSNELEQKLFDAEDSAEFEIGEAAKLLQLASFNTNYAKDDATEWIQRNFGNTQHNTTPGGDGELKGGK